MSIPRNFHFPISTLTRDAQRLLGALTDSTVGPLVTARLTSDFAVTFEAQITLVTTGNAKKSGAIGAIGELTQEQVEALPDLERLMAGARRTAALTFPKNDARLHSEFQVGIHEPQDFASELARAELILAACKTHAAALAEEGWSATDTTLLEQTIALLGGGDLDQEAAKDKKLGITSARNTAANLLYKYCLRTQNAARLAYPSTLSGKADGLEEARARYLLDEFPPRGGASAGDAPTPPPAPGT